ncbi:Vesicle membrane receptor protein (v-SNARE) [Basidiobolus ranarum]|uniref:Vesicle membrane receptor protein (V-SNARE) n=1 Tax=Basidiobolus ranarum TaxID=34480 RepID=A0ABR2X1Y8_9FUNG
MMAIEGDMYRNKSLWITHCREMSQPNSQNNKTDQIKSQVDEVVGIMQDNIERVMDRGEKLDILNNKAVDLEQGARQFKKGATKMKKRMWWKDMKLRLIILAIVIILLVAIIVPVVIKTQTQI